MRHDGEADRMALGAELAHICRRNRLALVVAGDARLATALRAGVHLRSGRWPGPVRMPRHRRGSLITSSAHGPADLVRAARAGAELVFLSPAFATTSHPDVAALGPARWLRLAGLSVVPVAALGGVTGRNVRRLPARSCVAVGAIGALVLV